MAPWLIILIVCGGYLAAVLVMGLVPGWRVSKSVTGYVVVFALVTLWTRPPPMRRLRPYLRSGTPLEGNRADGDPPPEA